MRITGQNLVPARQLLMGARMERGSIWVGYYSKYTGIGSGKDSNNRKPLRG